MICNKNASTTHGPSGKDWMTLYRQYFRFLPFVMVESECRKNVVDLRDKIVEIEIINIEINEIYAFF